MTKSKIVKVSFDPDGISGFFASYGYSSSYGIGEVEGATAHRAFGLSSESYADAVSDAMDQLGFEGSAAIDLEDEQIISNQFDCNTALFADGDKLLQEAMEVRFESGETEEEIYEDMPELGVLLTIWIKD